MSLESLNICINTLWLGAKGNQTSPLHMNTCGSIWPVCTPCSWFVVVLLWTPSNSTYICDLLHDFLLSYAVINSPLVGYPYVCLNFYTFAWIFSFLILPTWPHGGNQQVLNKWTSALLCGAVGVSLLVGQTDMPLIRSFPVQSQGINMLPHIGSMCPWILV